MIIDCHMHVARTMTGFWQPLRYGKALDQGVVRQLLDWVRKHCSFLTAEQRAAILGGTAERFLATIGL